MSVEYKIPHKHTLKILCKFKHLPRRYKRKCEWVFFSEHSILLFLLLVLLLLVLFNQIFLQLLRLMPAGQKVHFWVMLLVQYLLQTGRRVIPNKLTTHSYTLLFLVQLTHSAVTEG